MFFGKLGMPELLIILAIAAFVFGPKRLPQLGRAVGDTIRSFRDAGKELHGPDPTCPACGAAAGDGKFCSACGAALT